MQEVISEIKVLQLYVNSEKVLPAAKMVDALLDLRNLVARSDDSATAILERIDTYLPLANQRNLVPQEEIAEVLSLLLLDIETNIATLGDLESV